MLFPKTSRGDPFDLLWCDVSIGIVGVGAHDDPFEYGCDRRKRGVEGAAPYKKSAVEISKKFLIFFQKVLDKQLII